MKLVKQEVKYVMCDGIKKGDILEIENTLSCDKQVVKVIEIMQDGMKVIKLSSGQIHTYGYKELSNYEAKKMKLVYNDANVSPESSKEALKEDQECNEYATRIKDMIEQVLGKNVAANVNVYK